ncbi:MAG: hypothetical protein HY902_01190, partial [Deltaproteobacteria bacterium]|nr:hypothetical protein [Deltaproteobacteria bacterium]
PLDQGFHHVVDIVLNTSRLWNAMACCGMLWRSYREASGFARYRRAFGQPIGRFANTDAMVAQVFAEACAATASTLDLVAVDEAGSAPEAVRLGLNMNKYWTSVRTTQMIRGAMEVIGGNAAIEDFTPLGRLYRDALVTESWEGAHNVLIAQCWRDMLRLGLHKPWFDWLGRRLAGLADGAARDQLVQRLQHLQGDAQALVASQDPSDARKARAFVENAMVAHQGVCLVELAAKHGAAINPAVVQHFLELHPHRQPGPSLGWWPERDQLT